MEFNSAFLDTLKLLLKDKYVMSDRDYRTLSDILLKLGLVDVAETGLLTALVYFMDKNSLRFPISYNFMKGLWEKSNLVVDFNSMLSRLVLAQLVSLRKLTPQTFFNSSNIDRHAVDVEGQEYYLVVYGTQKFNALLNEIIKSGIMKEKLEDVGYIKLTEGINFKSLDGKYKKFVLTTTSLIRTKMFTQVRVESYDYDSIKNEIDFNFVITVPKSSINLKDSVLRRVFKKWVKGDFILGTDSYMDGNDLVFFTLKLDMRILPQSFRGISDNITYAVNELLDLAGGINNGCE
jgi:hypothetical protein